MMVDTDILKQTWDCSSPVSVNGRQYRLTQSSLRDVRDGTRLWPVGIALAQVVDTLLLNDWPLALAMSKIDDDHAEHPSINRTVCVVGDGIGLTSIVASTRWARVTMLDKCEKACALAEKNAADNFARVSVLCEHWSQAGGSFDYIFGAEVIYANYDIRGLVDFVDRTWTRKGACLFMVQTDKSREEFENIAVDEHSLICEFGKHKFMLPSGVVSECFSWSIIP